MDCNCQLVFIWCIKMATLIEPTPSSKGSLKITSVPHPSWDNSGEWDERGPGGAPQFSDSTKEQASFAFVVLSVVLGAFTWHTLQYPCISDVPKNNAWGEVEPWGPLKFTESAQKAPQGPRPKQGSCMKEWKRIVPSLIKNRWSFLQVSRSMIFLYPSGPHLITCSLPEITRTIEDPHYCRRIPSYRICVDFCL